MTVKAVIVQARMSSSRLPGKSLLDLCGQPLIYYVFDRVKRVKGIDAIILATSTDPSDTPLVDYAAQQKVRIFRGDLQNVQKRYYDAAEQCNVDVIIRVTGDNPLIAPELIEYMLEVWEHTKVDYIGYQRTCIIGAGAELFTRESLAKAMALLPTYYAREHVTPAYYKKGKYFKSLFLKPPPEYVAEDLRLTVDTPEDFAFVASLYQRFARSGYVSIPDIVALHSSLKG